MRALLGVTFLVILPVVKRLALILLDGKTPNNTTSWRDAPLNRILSKKMLGSVVTSSGKSLVLSATTKTTSWERPDYAADAMKTFSRDPQMIKPKSRREGLLCW